MKKKRKGKKTQLADRYASAATKCRRVHGTLWGDRAYSCRFPLQCEWERISRQSCQMGTYSQGSLRTVWQPAPAWPTLSHP